MNNKKVARVIAIILALVMLLSVAWVIFDTVVASALVTQAEINRLKEQKKEFQKRKGEIQTKINTIEFERMTEIAKKSVLDDRIMLTGMEIDNITETIEFYVVLIKEKEIEVVEAKKKEATQLQLYKTRVRDMEENGVISYLEIIFDSTSFSDLLARIDFVGDIMRADEKTYNRLIAARLETEAAEESLRKAMMEMEEEKLSLEIKQSELEEQLNEAHALIEQIEADLAIERAMRAEIQAEEDRVQREISAKEAEWRRQEERAQAAAAERARGTGELMWPVPSNGTVSSGFGIRMHPVFRVMRQHWGIDIPAKHGANVVASDSGTVIVSAYNSTHGNYVVISHGNVNGASMTTLYAHLSSRGVKENQSVTKGQVIGRIGSTGVSTGPHLHFEVTVNGSRVNPMKYL